VTLLRRSAGPWCHHRHLHRRTRPWRRNRSTGPREPPRGGGAIPLGTSAARAAARRRRHTAWHFAAALRRLAPSPAASQAARSFAALPGLFFSIPLTSRFNFIPTLRRLRCRLAGLILRSSLRLDNPQKGASVTRALHSMQHGVNPATVRSSAGHGRGKNKE
jgi:hypothetical protein